MEFVRTKCVDTSNYILPTRTKSTFYKLLSTLFSNFSILCAKIC